jgi:hypothetical protein
MLIVQHLSDPLKGSKIFQNSNKELTPRLLGIAFPRSLLAKSVRSGISKISVTLSDSLVWSAHNPT